VRPGFEPKVSGPTGRRPRGSAQERPPGHLAPAVAAASVRPALESKTLRPLAPRPRWSVHGGPSRVPAAGVVAERPELERHALRAKVPHPGSSAIEQVLLAATGVAGVGLMCLGLDSTPPPPTALPPTALPPTALPPARSGLVRASGTPTAGAPRLGLESRSRPRASATRAQPWSELARRAGRWADLGGSRAETEPHRRASSPAGAGPSPLWSSLRVGPARRPCFGRPRVRDLPRPGPEVSRSSNRPQPVAAGWCRSADRLSCRGHYSAESRTRGHERPRPRAEVVRPTRSRVLTLLVAMPRSVAIPFRVRESPGCASTIGVFVRSCRSSAVGATYRTGDPVPGRRPALGRLLPCGRCSTNALGALVGLCHDEPLEFR
jgi:hypothetical protein